MATAPPPEAAIERLHRFFVDWYTGQLDDAAVDRLEAALAPSFRMVTPAGRELGRAAVIDAIGDARGRDEPGAFDIEIRGVDVRHDLGDHVVVRYEEWQASAGEVAGRLSTAVLSRDDDAPDGYVWLDVHETRLDG